MSDRYFAFTHSPIGGTIANALGLPQPPKLARARHPWATTPLDDQGVLLAADGRAELCAALVAGLTRMGAEIRVDPNHSGLGPVKAAAKQAKVTVLSEPDRGAGPASRCIVFDATGVRAPDELRALYDLFHARIRELPAKGRILIIGRDPGEGDQIGARTCAAALRGFVRSLAKEVGKKGITANHLEVAPVGEAGLDAALRFFLTPHSAFVTGQTLALGASTLDAVALPGSLTGKVAVVTGAARGIGASIAEVMAREGAQIIGIDHPSQEAALGETLSRLGGRGLALDVTAPDAAERIAESLRDAFGGIDIIVHNAGVTRDKMIRNMPPHFWEMVLDINLGAILRINEGLLKSGLNAGARAVCISSIGGIAGNAGQTNYGATKAGVIGYVDAMAETFAERGGAINAVAPGFIETQMTAQMPTGPREVGRRLSSLSQGGQPQDIAEAVAFFASPAASGINGRTLRVCGQNFVGA
jgi:3-oxoacyl-[acyl-carrier protein] reductase